MDATKRTGTGPGGAVRDAAGVKRSRPTYPESPLSAEQIYHDYAPRVYNVARRMLSSDVDAEDVTQDVLLKVVRKLPSFRGDSAFPTWLHRITVNTALSHRRKQAVRSEHGLGNDPGAVLETGRPARPAPGTGDRETSQGPVPQLLSREAQVLIERAIDGLPETYRTVFILADVEGLPNAAIAESLGLSVPAIKSRLHRARLLMREALSPHFEEIAAGTNG